MSVVVVVFTEGGVVVADGAAAAARVFQAATSADETAFVVRVADDVAPAVDFIKNVSDVQTIGANVARGDLNANVKEAFASLLGMLAAAASLPFSGVAGALAADLAMSEAFKRAYDAASRWSSETDWSPFFDLLDGGEVSRPVDWTSPTDAIERGLIDPETLLPRVPQETNDRWRDAQSFTPRRDPLFIDLDADGLELRAADGAVLFDHNADGIRTGTGWAFSDDALLVWDRNANGAIDSGRELFGVDTIKANGQLASDGFDALRDLDSNADGLFSAADAQFANLRLWRDLDQDGVADAGELGTLAAASIQSISLTATPSGALINNNRVDSTAQVVRTGGLPATTAGAIDFAENTFAREFTGLTVTGTVTLTPTAQALPQMRGSGMVRDLREAMSLNTAASAALVAAMQGFAAAGTRGEQLGALDALVRAWGATSEHGTSSQVSVVLSPPGSGGSSSTETAVARWAAPSPELYQRIEALEPLQRQQLARAARGGGERRLRGATVCRAGELGQPGLRSAARERVAGGRGADISAVTILTAREATTR
jgi:hypothetical protein